MLDPTAATLLQLPRPLLLDGAMHCPPDLPSPNELAPGGGGNAAYVAMLDALRDEGHAEHGQAMFLAARAMNAELVGGRFDPFHFAKRDAQRRLDRLWNAAPPQVG